MARPFRQQVDEGILDRTAALLARRGFAKTSLQDVAAAVGLSKAGLLHHFPSKEALHAAVLAQVEALGQHVLEQVADLPHGPARDRYALDVLVDIALTHPGLVELLLAPVMQGDPAPEVDAAAATTLLAFGVTAGDQTSERAVRVVGALSALAALVLAGRQQDTATTWRPFVVATCFDALGHSGAGAALPRTDQVEA